MGTVLIIADGAVWIWNLAKDSFKDATQRIDAYHIKEHLWVVAHDIYGKGTSESIHWITPLLGYLDRRKDGTLDVIVIMDSAGKSVVFIGQKNNKDGGRLKRVLKMEGVLRREIFGLSMATKPEHPRSGL